MVSELDWQKIHDQIMYHYRLRALPVAVKYLESRKEMMALPSIALSGRTCTPCMAIGQAARIDTVVGITSENFSTDYCRSIHGFKERDEKWLSAAPFLDRWNNNIEAARAHHQALNVLPVKYEAFAAAPLYRGAIQNPDACALFGTPGQVFWILVGSVNVEYKKRVFSFAGESTCNDSWVHTALTGEPGLAIGSFGERSMAGMPEDELLVSMRIQDVLKALEGAVNMKAGRESLCYPVPHYSLVGDLVTRNPAFEGY